MPREPVHELVVPPAESVRISVCRPRRYVSGRLARTSWALVMWSAAVLEPAFPGRRTAATGSLLPPGPRLTKATFLTTRRTAHLVKARG